MRESWAGWRGRRRHDFEMAFETTTLLELVFIDGEVYHTASSPGGTNGNQLTNCFAHGLRLLDTWSLKAKIQPINLSHIIQPRRKT